MVAGAAAACRAPAKVNLYLDVLGRRRDGYHDLETLFLEVPWGDEVHVRVEPAPAGRTDDEVALEVQGSIEVPAGPANLAVQAARAFLDAAASAPDALPQQVHVTLHKRVPVGTGLGGGSADAAAVLRLLAGLLPGRAPPGGLEALARTLGADVPFLLRGGAAIGRERGDRLAFLEPPVPPPLVLILPPFGCDTGAVFRAFGRVRAAPSGGVQAAVDALRTADAARMRAAHYNALAFAALKVHPRLRAFTSDVERRLGRPPALTGSGSALFDVPDPDDVEGVLERLDGLPGTRVVAAH